MNRYNIFGAVFIKACESESCVDREAADYKGGDSQHEIYDKTFIIKATFEESADASDDINKSACPKHEIYKKFIPFHGHLSVFGSLRLNGSACGICNSTAVGAEFNGRVNIMTALNAKHDNLQRGFLPLYINVTKNSISIK